MDALVKYIDGGKQSSSFNNGMVGPSIADRLDSVAQTHLLKFELSNSVATSDLIHMSAIEIYSIGFCG